MDPKIIHRDLKPENFMICNDVIKVADFGWSNNLGNRQTYCGTLNYMAPEIIERNYYDEMVDVWSLGVILYEITHGYLPFNDNQKIRSMTNFIQNVETNIIKGALKIYNNINPRIKALIQKML